MSLALNNWALDFYPDRPGSNPTIGGNFVSYASFLYYDFHVVRRGLVRDLALLRRKCLRMTINDDLFGEGECYCLSILSR